MFLSALSVVGSSSWLWVSVRKYRVCRAVWKRGNYLYWTSSVCH